MDARIAKAVEDMARECPQFVARHLADRRDNFLKDELLDKCPQRWMLNGVAYRFHAQQQPQRHHGGVRAIQQADFDGAVGRGIGDNFDL